jgi:hypothetical protein
MLNFKKIFSNLKNIKSKIGNFSLAELAESYNDKNYIFEEIEIWKRVVEYASKSNDADHVSISYGELHNEMFMTSLISNTQKEIKIVSNNLLYKYPLIKSFREAIDRGVIFKIIILDDNEFIRASRNRVLSILIDEDDNSIDINSKSVFIKKASPRLKERMGNSTKNFSIYDDKNYIFVRDVDRHASYIVHNAKKNITNLLDIFNNEFQ